MTKSSKPSVISSNQVSGNSKGSTSVPQINFRPPVVAVMGHVDHGKTTLLDKIRSTNVVAKEVGGISQRLTASTITFQNHQITFIDTPGHAAFVTMRSRGGQAADLALLVVSAVEGVKPQTLEALGLIRTSQLPLIVVLTKTDLPEADVLRVKEDLLKEGVLLEGLGGDIVCLEVSGITGAGIEPLLEMINLTADMLELKQDLTAPYSGIVIESRLDPKKGPVALAIGKQGILRIGQIVIAGGVSGKVKAMMDMRGERVLEASPSTPVEILGFNDVPGAGQSIQIASLSSTTITSKPESNIVLPTEGCRVLSLIVRADSEGVLEAIRESLLHLPAAAKRLSLLFLDTGDVTTSDVMLAHSAGALILAFAVKIPATVTDYARQNQVDIHSFEIIYELTQAIEKAMEKLAEVDENSGTGRAQILKIFTLPSGDRVLGAKIISGRIKVNDPIRVLREGVEIFSSKVKNLQIKEAKVSAVGNGAECGILLRGRNEIKADDILEVSKPTA